MNRLRCLFGLCLIVLLFASGCASQAPAPTTHRQALLGLGDKAATQVLKSSVLQDTTPKELSNLVLLLPPSKIDASLDVDSERFRESLSRGLLGKSPGPQVLDWAPKEQSLITVQDGNQWILESRLEASGDPLRLSDRELVPYRLILSLRRPGERQPQWQGQLSGAIDTTAL